MARSGTIHFHAIHCIDICSELSAIGTATSSAIRWETISHLPAVGLVSEGGQFWVVISIEGVKGIY